MLTSYEDDTVAAFDFEGKQKWKFQDERFIRPHGLSATNDGFIFFACGFSNNVMFLSPDRQNGRVVLDETDGILNPKGIYYNVERKELLVINENKAEVFVYEVNW